MPHGHLSSLCRIVVLAGDTLPIDVYCHLPVMCEDRNLPYAYIPSKVVSLSPWRCCSFDGVKPRFSCYYRMLLVWSSLVFGSAFRTWDRRRGQRGQPAWSWSNLMRTIRIPTTSVWRKCPASPNPSEEQPSQRRADFFEISKDYLNLQVSSFMFPYLSLISNTLIRL